MSTTTTMVVATDAPDGADLLDPVAAAHAGSVYEQKGLDGDPFPWVLAVPATIAAVTAVRDVVLALLAARRAVRVTVGGTTVTGVGPEDAVAIITLLAEHGALGSDPSSDVGEDDDEDGDPSTDP